MLSINNKYQKSNIRHWLILRLIDKLSLKNIIKLVNYFGGAENVLLQDANILTQVVGRVLANQIKNSVFLLEKVEQELKWQDKDKKQYIISIDDDIYPQTLRSINNPPIILYVCGNISLLKNYLFSVIGTKQPTKLGSQNAFVFSKDLANNGFTVVSGLSQGIERSAHLGALFAVKKTIAILSCGIDVIHPKDNTDLYSKIIQNNGLIISEFPLGTRPLAINTARKNYLIAGISLGCLLVESSYSSNALVIANEAINMDKEVTAIPGAINNPMSKGCHQLIKNGAKLVENIYDILDEFKYLQEKYVDNTDDLVLKSMGFEPITINEIVTKLNGEHIDLYARMLELELNGDIINCGNGQYRRVLKINVGNKI